MAALPRMLQASQAAFRCCRKAIIDNGVLAGEGFVFHLRGSLLCQLVQLVRDVIFSPKELPIKPLVSVTDVFGE